MLIEIKFLRFKSISFQEYFRYFNPKVKLEQVFAEAQIRTTNIFHKQYVVMNGKLVHHVLITKQTALQYYGQ